MATVIAPDHYSAVEDAEALQKACKGWGTDEKAIISVLGHRNAAQRKQIRLAYEELYQEDLIKRLESELSGDFERAVYRWILDPADRDAVLANVAIRKSSPDHHVIIEISCTRSPEELLAVRRAYQARYKHSLEEDVAAHTKGDIRTLLVVLVSAFRYDGEEINTRVANSEAKTLHDAIKDKAFNHEEVIRIMSTRSKMQLMATFNRYRDDQGTSITKNLPGASGDEFLLALRTAVRCLNDPKKYFEKVLRSSIKRTGTDEDGLTRVIVTRAEKDLKEIKDLYYKRNSVPLDQAVAKDTSGDYKAFLLTLLGKED
ncbi:annexin-like protein RJ4 isoform X2 [Durio zibethinus]|uniref:Annexin n=1 Tax=Durio zibethinus TaxID=66656 RepID=A0A6P6AIY6_DURZI|nr:annexin-like protein RJ4 isoform X2 [Durio zibethinus]